MILGGCAASSPKIEQADAVRRLMAHYRGPVSVENGSSVSPDELVALSSEKAFDFVPAVRGQEEEFPAEENSWFLEPGILNEECPHCRERGNIISSEYGKRRDPVRNRKIRQHNGVDIRVPTGSAALAFRGGKVVRASRFSTYGLTVDIQQYDGYLARYAHLNKIMTKVGEEVDAGVQIGEVGRTGRTTGPHLHFELIKDGESVDPLNMLSRVEQVVRCNMLEAAKAKE
ncbi:MAG TPA: M23 family metallopeptidase [Candidatus Mailhella merdavium]|nr:M23 family metallopeptidase [Candidatus Mailhella merdavium]